MTKMKIILSKKTKKALEVRMFKDQFDFASYFKKNPNICKAIINGELYYRCKDEKGFIRFTNGIDSTLYIEANTYILF